VYVIILPCLDVTRHALILWFPFDRLQTDLPTGVWWNLYYDNYSSCRLSEQVSVLSWVSESLQTQINMSGVFLPEGDSCSPLGESGNERKTVCVQFVSVASSLDIDSRTGCVSCYVSAPVCPLSSWSQDRVQLRHYIIMILVISPYGSTHSSRSLHWTRVSCIHHPRAVCLLPSGRSPRASPCETCVSLRLPALRHVPFNVGFFVSLS
jgi:hypothetical protein